MPIHLFQNSKNRKSRFLTKQHLWDQFIFYKGVYPLVKLDNIILRMAGAQDREDTVFMIKERDLQENMQCSKA